jgi:integrase/recombinase XerC
MKLSTAIRRFDAQLRADGKSPRTRDAYHRDLLILERSVGPKTPINLIRSHRLARLINSSAFSRTRDGRLKTTASLNRSKTAVRTFFRFLANAGYIKENPARLIQLGRFHRKPPRPMSRAEVKKLMATMKKQKDTLAERDCVAFNLMLATGIRLGSLVGISLSDVDLSGGTIKIHGKGGVEQMLPLTRALRTTLARYVKRLDRNSQVLFASRAGNRLQARQVQLRFAKWLRAAGIAQDYTVHCLRHTFATRLYEQTGDIRLVQRALGHRSISTTEIYTRVADARLKRAMESLKLSR